MRFRSFALTFASCALALALPVSAGSTLRVQSWNMLHAGWTNHTNWSGYANQLWTDFGSTSSAANGLDLVFAQEIMSSSAAASIASALKSKSGYTWDYRVTGLIGRTSYKEAYAVFFRTDRVQLLSHTVYSDTNDRFEREPQIVKVRHVQTGEDYTFINWHTIWGETAERQAEIAAIRDVFAQVQSGSSSDQDVILLGDHNRDATSPWWDNLESLSPAVSHRVNEYTTINTSCGYANKYDHFWLQSTYVAEYSSGGRDYIADTCSFRNGLSDHAPIFANFYSSANTD